MKRAISVILLSSLLLLSLPIFTFAVQKEYESDGMNNSDFFGTWKAVKISLRGDDIPIGNFAGGSFTIKLNGDGSGIWIIGGEEYNITWYGENGALTIIDESGSGTYGTLTNGAIVLNIEGTFVTLTKCLIAINMNTPTLTLFTGQETSLTVSTEPALATLPALTWKSSNNAVVTVNENGRITAASPGTADITATGGGFSATCSVTVEAKQNNEYKLGLLTVRDENGKALSAIPSGSFYVTVPVTKLTENGNAQVLLATYNDNGQYKDMMLVKVEDVPKGGTIKVSLLVENKSNDIKQLKAFVTSGFGSFTPLGEASVFPA